MKDAALAIVTNTQQEILLVQRRDVPVWVLPGGGIECNESAEIAAIRETFEETGVCVEIEEHIATYNPVNRWTSQTHLFSCRPTTIPAPFAAYSEEVAEVRFFPIFSLPKNLFPIHRSIIADWEQARSVPIIRPLHEASYPALFRLLFSHPLLTLRYLVQRARRNKEE